MSKPDSGHDEALEVVTYPEARVYARKAHTQQRGSRSLRREKVRAQWTYRHHLMPSVFTLFVMGVVAVLGFILSIVLQDEHGYVGTVGAQAEGMGLSCGGKYYPHQKMVFHPTLPCGSTVEVIAPNGTRTTGTVASQKVPFKQGTSRVADISEGMAEALGLDLKATEPTVLNLRVLNNRWYDTFVAALPAAMPLMKVPASGRPAPTAAELTLHVRNVLGEAEEYGPLAYIPVVQTTVNRLAVKYRGQSTLEGVIYDPWQFTWTKRPVPISAKGSAAWKQAEVMVRRILTDRLNGEALAVQYVTQDSVIYYDGKYIKAPSWALSDEFTLIEMTNTMERRLGIRPFRFNPGTRYATRLANNT